MSYAETIRVTPLPKQQLTVVTLKLADQHRLRPYLTFVRDDRTGEAFGLLEHATVAAAMQAHDEIAKKKGAGPQATAPGSIDSRTPSTGGPTWQR